MKIRLSKHNKIIILMVLLMFAILILAILFSIEFERLHKLNIEINEFNELKKESINEWFDFYRLIMKEKMNV